MVAAPVIYRETALLNSDRDESIREATVIQAQRFEELSNDIEYRTCSWRKTAALLACQYIALPVMSFPTSYAVLGLAPALIITLAVAGVVYYTSMITWRFCLRHPDVRDVCDAGQLIFWNSKVVWYVTAVMFILNNAFVAGIHVLIGARYLDTVAGPGICNVVYAVIVTIVSFILAVPRTFAALSSIALATAMFTFVSILLALVFAGIQDHPAGYNSGKLGNGLLMTGEPRVDASTPRTTSWIAAVNSFLNISYTFIGQITLPSYIAEMENPRDFPKALTIVTVFEVVLFTLTGSLIYVYVGAQYITSPAFSSIQNGVLMEIAFSFMVPTLVFTGSLYSSVSARFIFFRIFENSKHKSNHTLTGWTSWVAILAVLWLLTFVIAEVIPFFGDLLSLVSAIFNSNFGFIYWAFADLSLKSASVGGIRLSRLRTPLAVYLTIDVLLILIGLFMLGIGSYTSIKSIIQSFQTGSVTTVFSCKTNPY